MKIKAILILFFLININNCFSQYIKGTHFFGNSSPLNFWNSNEIFLTDKYFSNIKKDGFNTIILIIPFREFIMDSSCYKKLEYYFKMAKKYNLYVILRVSYFWDLCRSNITLPELFLKLATDNNTLKLWKNYLKNLYTISSKYNNFLFGFLSWEDFWIYTNGEILKRFPEYKNFYNQFKNYVLKKFNIKIKKFPLIKEYNYKFLLYFFDYLITEKLYKIAKSVFPPLTMEARVDYDPIYKNGKFAEWFIHKKTFNPLNSKIVVVYYAPFMGQKNIGDEISCDTAIKTLNFLLNNFIKFSNKKNLFIDQFNFISYVPVLKNNTRIKKSDLCCFLDKSKLLLSQKTTGYSIWSYKFYKLNLLYNSSFENQLYGWKHKNASIILNKKDKWLKLSKNSYISQKIGEFAYFNYQYYGNFNLCFKAYTNKNKGLLKFKIFPSQKFTNITVSKELKTFCYKIKNKNEIPEVIFKAANDNVYIDDIYLYNFVEKSGIYNFNNNKLWFTDCFLNFNNFQPQYLIRNLFNDKWMGKMCEIKIFKKVKLCKLNIEFFLPDIIPVNTVYLKMFCNNNLLKILKLKKGLNFYKIKLKNCKNIKFISNYTFYPYKILKNPKDKRKLSVIIKNLNIKCMQ